MYRNIKKFTLVELLVIITIIGILSSLLVTLMAQMQDKAKDTECRGNLKNIYDSIALYCGDNRNDMPEGLPGTGVKSKRYFVFDMAPYLDYEERVYPNADSGETLWYKDACLGIDVNGRYAIPEVLKCRFRQDDGYIGYGWNYWFIHGGSGSGRYNGGIWERLKIGQVIGDGVGKQRVKHYDQQMILGDSSNTQKREAYKAGRPRAGIQFMSQRHEGVGGELGGNYLFMDGHTGWKSKSFTASKEAERSFWSVY